MTAVAVAWVTGSVILCTMFVTATWVGRRCAELELLERRAAEDAAQRLLTDALSEVYRRKRMIAEFKRQLDDVT